MTRNFRDDRFVRTATRHHRETTFRISTIALVIATLFEQNITWSIYRKLYTKYSSFS